MKKLYSFLLFFLVLSSCAVPQVVTQLTPQAPEGNYQMGREYIPLSNDSILVELGFDGLHGEYLVFDFVVINRTPHTLQIDPTEFYYVVLDSVTADSSKLPPRMALHPERVVHHYDETLEAKAQQKSTNSIIGFLDAGIELLVNASAFFATDDPGYMVDAVVGTVGKATHYVANDERIESDMSVIKSEKEVVNEEIFRQASLPTGKVASGYVFFPTHSETEVYMFCFPVEDQLFQFVYCHEKGIAYL